MSVVPMTVAIAGIPKGGALQAMDALVPAGPWASPAGHPCRGLGIRRADGLVERPAGAAAIGHLRYLCRSGAHRRSAAQHVGNAGRVAAGFGLGVAVATIVGAATGYSAHGAASA